MQYVLEILNNSLLNGSFSLCLKSDDDSSFFDYSSLGLGNELRESASDQIAFIKEEDLKTVINTVLRIHFAKNRFRKSNLEKPKDVKESNIKIKSNESLKKRMLKRLESEVLKRSKGSMHVLSQLVDYVFNSKDTMISEPLPKHSSVSESLTFPTDNAKSIIEDGSDPPSEDSKTSDLNRSTIRALAAVISMLACSDKISHAVTPEYFKKQLYADKQNMPDSKLRNVIVLYASNCGYRISPKQLNLCTVSHYDDKEYESIHVTSKGLYSLFRAHYHMFQEETDNSVRKFTSVASTGSNEKELFRNLFNVDYLLKRFKQQNLDPVWSFEYDKI
ncbi:uncharacterized protein EV154DRAFT_483084 [Mucor mucedo]|uniref:uncharacterized protein n=1 Tax=Mucor mucedo TaxID=29922 RepID=UPI0022209225|nr:uncharacterized protein EV154DRAFT_483084 [Mucor mucedo]KAI7889495.1 hypothetical protein EV154DRAFT_483084 [Mucor mucedo]